MPVLLCRENGIGLLTCSRGHGRLGLLIRRKWRSSESSESGAQNRKQAACPALNPDHSGPQVGSPSLCSAVPAMAGPWVGLQPGGARPSRPSLSGLVVRKFESVSVAFGKVTVMPWPGARRSVVPRGTALPAGVGEGSTGHPPAPLPAASFCPSSSAGALRHIDIYLICFMWHGRFHKEMVRPEYFYGSFDEEWRVVENQLGQKRVSSGW